MSLVSQFLLVSYSILFPKKISESDIVPMGDVINGDHQGRVDDNEITLFDGTGVGLQDLAVASAVAELFEKQGTVRRISL